MLKNKLFYPQSRLLFSNSQKWQKQTFFFQLFQSRLFFLLFQTSIFSNFCKIDFLTNFSKIDHFSYNFLRKCNFSASATFSPVSLHFSSILTSRITRKMTKTSGKCVPEVKIDEKYCNRLYSKDATSS